MIETILASTVSHLNKPDKGIQEVRPVQNPQTFEMGMSPELISYRKSLEKVKQDLLSLIMSAPDSPEKDRTIKVITQLTIKINQGKSAGSFNVVLGRERYPSLPLFSAYTDKQHPLPHQIDQYFSSFPRRPSPNDPLQAGVIYVSGSRGGLSYFVIYSKEFVDTHNQKLGRTTRVETVPINTSETYSRLSSILGRETQADDNQT